MNYCKHVGNVDEGYALLKDMAPTIPLEYILKAVALTLVGQEHNSVSLCMLKLNDKYCYYCNLFIAGVIIIIIILLFISLNTSS